MTTNRTRRRQPASRYVAFMDLMMRACSGTINVSRGVRSQNPCRTRRDYSNRDCTGYKKRQNCDH
jgi:hypothetical protein